jgi:PAS domain S-box-containing protein
MEIYGLGDFLKQLIDQLYDAIFFIDPEDYSIMEVNEAACVSLGYAYAELKQLTIPAIDPNIKKRVDETLQDTVAEANQKIRFESTHKRKDGSTFPVEISSKVLSMEGKLYICATVHDLTRRKSYEEALMKKNKSLQEFKDIAVGRELKMIELKQEINALHEEKGDPPPYPIC